VAGRGGSYGCSERRYLSLLGHAFQISNDIVIIKTILLHRRLLSAYQRYHSKMSSPPVLPVEDDLSDMLSGIHLDETGEQAGKEVLGDVDSTEELMSRIDGLSTEISRLLNLIYGKWYTPTSDE
jgi:hypothetical protein